VQRKRSFSNKEMWTMRYCFSVAKNGFFENDGSSKLTTSF
jgi:hypothetical protein